MLQHLCNTFNNCVPHCSWLPWHNNIASKVLFGKVLPYWSHVSEAEEKMQWLKMLAIVLWAYRLWCMSEGLSSIPSTLVNCFSKVSTFSMFKCVRVVLKGVAPTETQLYQPIPDQILCDRQWIDYHLSC